MKKYSVALICILIILTITAVWASATETNTQYTYQKNNTAYTVEFIETELSEEQQEQVANRLIHAEDSDATIYGLTCTLFGHKLTESTVGVITHKVRTYAPRCKREIYDVTVCERCDYQTQTLSGTSYILCCPED